MKAIITTILLVLFNYLQATILTVDISLEAPTSGVYTTFQNAYNAAVPGDTIYLKAAPYPSLIYTTTGSVQIQKEIHIIGEGIAPNNQINSYATGVAAIYFRSGSDGSSIQGVIANSISLIKCHNISISRCNTLISIGDSVSNINIYNNILSTIDKYYASGGVSNITIANNIIFNSYGISSSPPTIGVNGNILVKNNLFIKNNGYGFRSNPLNFKIANATFINNVFYGSSANYLNIESCIFSNNLSYNTIDNNFPTTGTNTGGGNIINLDPLFVNESNSQYTNTDDYNYPSNSPLVNAGTDGTDIGIYGGQYPWPEGGVSGSGFMYSQEPRLPQVDLLNVVNGGVPQNGTLNIRVRAVKNN